MVLYIILHLALGVRLWTCFRVDCCRGGSRWRKILPACTGHRCLAPDLVGYGASGIARERDYRFHRQAECACVEPYVPVDSGGGNLKLELLLSDSIGARYRRSYASMKRPNKER